MFKSLTLADKVLIVVCTAIALLSYLVVVAVVDTGSVVLIEVDGIVVHKLTITQDSETEIQGTRGRIDVRVSGGRVAIVHADCPNQICVRTGWRSRSGEIIVCVPNKTIVRILSKEGGPEAVTG